MPNPAKEVQPPKAQSKQRRMLQALVDQRVSETLKGGDGTEMLEAMRSIVPPVPTPQAPVAFVKVAPVPVATEVPAPMSTEPTGEVVAPSSEAGEFRHIALDLISPNPHQPRLHVNEAADEELASSIKQRGVLQPIVVRGMADGRYQLVSGERRFRASRAAGKTTVPAIVRETEDTHAALDALIENLHRENLGALETAKAYDRLLKLLNVEQEALAELLGLHVSRIRHAVRVLVLPQDILEQVLGPGSPLKLSHAEELLALRDNPPRLRLITQRLLAEQWTVERLRAEIQRRPRVNRGYQPAVFEDRGDKGYRLVVRLQTIRPQDYPMIRGHLEKALSRLTEFEAGGQEDKNF